MMKRWIQWCGGIVALVILFLGSGYYTVLHIEMPKPPDLKGAIRQQQLTVDSKPRSFQYYVPQVIAEQPAIVFVLHGSMGSGSQVRPLLGYDFERIAEREGFLVVYPDGFEGHWNDCRRNASYSANTQDIADLAFFSAMIDYFAKRYDALTSRVFATGYSNGGHMVYRLALEMPEKFLAVAAVAASLPDQPSMDCTASGKPISVAIFNGTNDPVNPFEGGQVEIFGDTSRGMVKSSQASAEYWAELAGVDAAPETETLPEVDGNPSTRITRQRWQATGGTQVWFYTMTGSGHVVPSANIRYGTFFGGAAGDIEGGEEIWKFFESVEPR